MEDLINILFTLYNRCEDLEEIGEKTIQTELVKFIIDSGLEKIGYSYGGEK